MLENNLREARCTDEASEILRLVIRRARARGRDAVDVSAIGQWALWSLVLWERKVGRVALEQLGVDPFELARGLDRLLTKKAEEYRILPEGEEYRILPEGQVGTAELAKPDFPPDIVSFHDALELLLQRAEHEARELGHDYVGSEHVVLAIVSTADPALTALLQEHGVSHIAVKEAVLRILYG